MSSYDLWSQENPVAEGDYVDLNSQRLPYPERNSARCFVTDFVEDEIGGNAIVALVDFASAGLVVNVLCVQPKMVFIFIIFHFRIVFKSILM